jgi:putative ABC transport system permease protein
MVKEPSSAPPRDATPMRWFRRLLRVLPSDFREAYGTDMERTFQAQHLDRSQAGRRGVAVLWIDTARGLLLTGLGAHADQLRQDAAFTVRMMRRRPGFTVLALAILALGIGATGAVVSVVDATLFPHLPYRDPDQIVRLYGRHTGYGLMRNAVSPPNVLDWRAQATAFRAIAAYRPRSLNLSGAGEPQYVQGARVSVEFFDVLGVRPVLGRAFTEAEDRALARVVVLSHGMWQRQFGTDRSVVGRTLDLDGERFEVLGVMPADFTYQLSAELLRSEARADLWMPLGLYPGGPLPSRGSNNLSVVARLSDGTTVAQAQGELSAIAARLARAYPMSNTGWDGFVEPLRESLVHEARPVAVALAAAVALMLVIGCVNISGLLMVRAAERGQEFALRASLGASGNRLSRQLLTESLVLSCLGGLLGVAVAAAAVSVLRASELPGARLDSLAVNQRVLLATAAMSVGVGVIFGMAPLWYASRRDPLHTLRQGTRGQSTGPVRRRVQSVLSVAQVAIALILLAGAGVMGRTLVNLSRVDPGFMTSGVLAVDLSLSDARYPTTEQATRFVQRVVEAASAVPGVRSASFISDPPLTGGMGYWEVGFDVEGRPPKSAGQGDFAYLRCVTPRYFETLGIPVQRGRSIGDADTFGSPVVIVNTAFALRHFAGADPLGSRITVHAGPDVPREVIGVVADVRQTSLAAPAEPQMYTPCQGAGSGTLLVRSDRDTVSLTIDVQAAIRAVDAQQPWYNVRRLDDHVRASFARERLTTVALAAFASTALVLSALGVYGVLAYVARQRRQEFGIRAAIGASSGSLLRMVVGDGLRIAVQGVALGAAGAIALTRLLATLLFDVTPADPVTLTLAVTVLLATCGLASLVPAVRAMRVDPVTALRDG